MMRITAVLILFLHSFLNGQNLVINPGFEECHVFDSTRTQWAIISNEDLRLIGWTMPSGGTADHYYLGDSNNVRLNHTCPQPYEGRCIAGFIAWDSYFEYVQGTISEPLERDSVYYFSFALATEFNDDFTEKRIGICFDSALMKVEKSFRLEWDPDLTLDTVANRSITGDWLIYQTWYKAKGGETCFAIGEFGKDPVPRKRTDAGYFFVDDFYLGGKPKGQKEATEIAAGKTLTLENVYFETAKSRILPDSYKPLEEIIAELKLQPSLKVKIIGHTDKHGNANDNQKLSEQRALAVKEFFVSRGIDVSRITTSGKGSSEPVGDEDSKNRRVEFRFYE